MVQFNIEGGEWREERRKAEGGKERKEREEGGREQRERRGKGRDERKDGRGGEERWRGEKTTISS